MKSPCYKCEHRFCTDGKTCHASCEKYAEWKKKGEKAWQDRCKENAAECDFISYKKSILKGSVKK